MTSPLNIVSFYAPRPDHPFFQDYTPFLQVLADSCRRFGHRHIIITDDPEIGRQPDCPGNAEFGIGDGFLVDLPDNLMRAIIMGQLQFLRSPLAQERDTILTGADCVLANDPAEAFEREFDIAVTTGDFTDCVLNTGAIFVRKEVALSAADAWASALSQMGDLWGDDQKALAAVLLPQDESGLTPIGHMKIAEFPVDPWNLAPRYPDDDCRHAKILHFRGPRKAWLVDYCAQWLGIGESPHWNVLPNTSDEVFLAQITQNSKLPLEWIRTGEPSEKPAVIIGGGASAKSMLPEIMLRKQNKQAIFALNGAGRWLSDNGVEPDFLIVLDAREENVRFLDNDPADIYLLASQVHPSLFERYPERTMLWHSATTEGLDDTLPPERLPSVQIGGGTVVGLSALALLFCIGYRNVHLYGYDSCDWEGESHAYVQNETKQEARRLKVWVGEREFACSPAMYKQAFEFEGFARMLAAHGMSISVHGDGLIPAIARKMEENDRIQFSQAAE